jgi:hypothetical protein
MCVLCDDESVRLEAYRLLAENAPDMITRHVAKGRVVFASAAADVCWGTAESI